MAVLGAGQHVEDDDDPSRQAAFQPGANTISFSIQSDRRPGRGFRVLAFNVQAADGKSASAVLDVLFMTILTPGSRPPAALPT